MLARLVRELPVGDDLVYEPKWDGFRCIAIRSGDDVDLRSRNRRPLARYFPELVAALRSLPEPEAVLDGEIVTATEGNNFAALMGRLHPAASRVAKLAAETPASFVAFDLLHVGGRDLLGEPFGTRRRLLESLLDGIAPPLLISPLTADPAMASAWLNQPLGRGIDGVMAKSTNARYEPGRRSPGMLKVKRGRTADCVVSGFRWYAEEPTVGSLLLGLYDDGVLRHVGVASSFKRATRQQLAEDLAPLAIPVEDHPWRDGFALEGGPMGRLPGAGGRWTPAMGLDWVPLQPERVAEVAYEQVDGIRFRHPARFRRWRPDRDAASCMVDQLIEDGR